MNDEENKVILKLEEYIKLLDKLKETEIKLNNQNVNYEIMCLYLKEQVKNDEEYHIKNIVNEKDFNIKDILTKKLKNYHYENIANDFIKVGITFDLIEKLVDEIIEEYKNRKEEK